MIYKLNIVQNLQYQFSGDPVQWTYDQVTNILVADAKKEIKGIYVSTDVPRHCGRAGGS